MQLLSEVIYSVLSSDSDIASVLESVSSDGNIWHCRIPQANLSGTDEVKDLSIYFYTYAVKPNDNKSGQSEVDEAMIRIAVVGQDTRKMSLIARYIRYALDRWSGTVNDITVQSIQFLNASFDPEGEYENEQQQWVLEFKARVIDNNIRIPGPVVDIPYTSLTNFSVDEQRWPIQKWFGETIYWKTWNLGTGADGYETLTGLDVADVELMLWGQKRATRTADDNEILAGVDIEKNGSGGYKVFTVTGETDIYITAWYTKTA